MITVFIVLNLSDGLSLIGACSKLELLLADVTLGTSRAGDDSPPKAQREQIITNYLKIDNTLQN